MHEGGVLCTRALSQKRVVDRSLKAAPPSCTVRVVAGANLAAGAPWTPLSLAHLLHLPSARQNSSAVAAPSRDCCRCQRRRACGEGSLRKRPVLDPKLDSLSARALEPPPAKGFASAPGLLRVCPPGRIVTENGGGQNGHTCSARRFCPSARWQRIRCAWPTDRGGLCQEVVLIARRATDRELHARTANGE